MLTMYKFHCGFRADNKLFSQQQQHCGTTGNHSAIRHVNLYYPLPATIEQNKNNENKSFNITDFHSVILWYNKLFFNIHGNVRNEKNKDC